MSEEEITRDDILRWIGSKTPLGILMIALAFTVVCTGVWVLSYAAVNFGWSPVS